MFTDRRTISGTVVAVHHGEQVKAIVAEQAQPRARLLEPIDICKEVNHPVAELVPNRVKPPMHDFATV